MNSDNKIFCETSYIKGRTLKICNEPLSFKGGKKLGDIDIFYEDSETIRKVRRIIEKRVCQDFYRCHHHVKGNAKHRTRHNVSCTIRNIFGPVALSA